MRPFPPAAELQFLVGLEVEQVCLDPWGTQFKLSGGAEVNVEGTFGYVEPEGAVHPHQLGDEQDRGPVLFRQLLQQRVALLTCEPLLLVLKFGNRSELRIPTMVGPHECGQIRRSGRSNDLIVF